MKKLIVVLLSMVPPLAAADCSGVWAGKGGIGGVRSVPSSDGAVDAVAGEELPLPER